MTVWSGSVGPSHHTHNMGFVDRLIQILLVFATSHTCEERIGMVGSRKNCDRGSMNLMLPSLCYHAVLSKQGMVFVL